MKTGEQILAEASKTIAHIHNRPTMYVGSRSRTGDANAIDGVLWMAHWFWAMIQSREDEFREVVAKVREKHECSCQGFPDAFRRHNPRADESAAFEHVLQCWLEVDSYLRIDTSETAARR